MDTKKSQELKELSRIHSALESWLKQEGFEWEYSISKPTTSSKIYRNGTLEVRLSWVPEKS